MTEVTTRAPRFVSPPRGKREEYEHLRQMHGQVFPETAGRLMADEVAGMHRGRHDGPDAYSSVEHTHDVAQESAA